ncbi:MAG: alpha-amylase family glycosyl hydrolase [Clostridium sp.]|nr:alpha-amylase family glycosyl hydrolase [Clostridium sp.]
MKKNYKKIKTKFLPIFLSSVVLFCGLSIKSSIVCAATYSGDASVTNKVNFDTDVIYQIVTDRFVDGDKTNNPQSNLYDPTHTSLKKYFGGDWKGITDKINDGYFTNMGITALWISPPVENIYSVMSGDSTSYHGYWARDYKKTNPFFGSFSDFQTLVNTAHANNIKVIIDFVPNHTSPADPSNTSYGENGRLYNDGTLLGGYTNDANNLFNHNGGTNFSTYEDCIYKNLYDLADLNQQNSVVDSYLKEAVNKWLDLGIDGLRIDAVKHMPMGWQKNFMDSVYNHKQVFTFGEWFLGANETDSNNINFANNSGMNLLDFRYAQKVRQVFRDGSDNMYGLDSMINSTANDYEHINDEVTFFDNHDMDRFYKVDDNKRNVENALVLGLTSRGVPAIYYGTEQYMTGNGDPYNRAMMTGFDTNTNAYKVIQKLAPLRKTNPAIAYGTTQQRWINNDVYVYERKFGNNVALVAINKNTTTSYTISGANTALPNGTYSDQLSGLLNGGAITVNNGAVNSFTLPAGASAVWQYTAPSNSAIIGHVGVTMAEPGQTVVIDGRGFGSTQGTVNFGTTAANVTSWSDSEIKVNVPNIPAGKSTISLKTADGTLSNTYLNFNVLTSKQVCVRFVVNNANTILGENVYLTGDVGELGSWDTKKAIGSMFNNVLYQYPTWYYDVSVPAGKKINFKFIKKNGTNVTWESGGNHTFTAPTSGTTTVTVNWQQ